MGLGGYQNGGGGRGGGHSGHGGPGLSAGAHRLLQASVHAGTGGNVMQYGHGPPNHGPPQGNYYQQPQNYGNYPPRAADRNARRLSRPADGRLPPTPGRAQWRTGLPGPAARRQGRRQGRRTRAAPASG